MSIGCCWHFGKGKDKADWHLFHLSALNHRLKSLRIELNEPKLLKYRQTTQNKNQLNELNWQFELIFRQLFRFDENLLFFRKMRFHFVWKRFEPFQIRDLIHFKSLLIKKMSDLMLWTLNFDCFEVNFLILAVSFGHSNWVFANA